MLAEKNNKGLHEFVKELLILYNKYPCLYELDNSWDGFEWISADDASNSTYAFVRKCKGGRNSLLFVLNMTPIKRENFKVGVPVNKKYKLLLNSDDQRFAGSGNIIPLEIISVRDKCNYKDYSITFDLPAYGAAVFVF